MNLGTSLLCGDVLIITFSYSNRVNIHYYHSDTDFKEVKNLPLLKNVIQLQPIIFQFIEDFLRSRIEVSFEKKDVVFDEKRLVGNIILIIDSNLSETFKCEIIKLYDWLIESLENNDFNKVIAEKTVKYSDTRKIEKVREFLFSDYQLFISQLDANEPELFKTVEILKSGSTEQRKYRLAEFISNEIIQNVGIISKGAKETLNKLSIQKAEELLLISGKEWKSEINFMNKSYPFIINITKFEKSILENEKNIKENKTDYQLIIPYNDINNLFSLLNNRKLSAQQFKLIMDDGFGNSSSKKLIDFLNLGEKISPIDPYLSISIKNNPTKKLGDLDVFGKEEEPSIALDHLFEGKQKEDKSEIVSIQKPKNRKWAMLAGLFILILTAVFAIPAILTPPLKCTDSLLLEMVKGNDLQVKRMVLGCSNCRNPEQQMITINDHDFSSPIILSIANGDLDILKFLVEKGNIPLDLPEKNSKSPNHKGWSAPWTAVAFNQPKILDYLALKEVDMDTRQDVSGETPLIHAISLNNKYLIKKLLDAGADPDYSDSKGITPLLYSIALDYVDITKILFLNGATIPPFISESELNLRVKSKDMFLVLEKYAPKHFSFLDAFQANSPFHKKVNGSYINEEENLVIHSNLSRMYPFNFSPKSDFTFSSHFDTPQKGDNGNFGIIFSSKEDLKYSFNINKNGIWILSKNGKTVKKGSFNSFKNNKSMKIRIQKLGSNFTFTINNTQVLKTPFNSSLGNYFGFQVSENTENDLWIIKKYKLTTL